MNREEAEAMVLSLIETLRRYVLDIDSDWTDVERQGREIVDALVAREPKDNIDS